MASSFDAPWLERGWVPVGEDGNGDYYLVGTSSSREPEGLVFFVDQMDFSIPDYAVGSDMWHFLYGLACQELRSEEWWPFERDRMLEVDPTLATEASDTAPVGRRRPAPVSDGWRSAIGSL